jgi:hypothetical protein
MEAQEAVAEFGQVVTRIEVVGGTAGIDPVMDEAHRLDAVPDAPSSLLASADFARRVWK